MSDGDVNAALRLAAGDRVGKYQVVRPIGEGGMATIYLASSVGPGGFTKPCALKVLRPEFAGHGERSATLVQEARIAALLGHPNIVQVFDFGEVGDSYFMAMEWVDGVALSQILNLLSREGRTLSVGAVAQIGVAVADALAYLSDGVELDGARASLVHRDVSPSNVLLSTTGLVKLTDFGVVKVLEAPTHTKIGVVKGKYGYMSPEQIRSEPIDHRSDVFALGVVLFESLTSLRLFHRKNLAATVAAVHAARVPPPSAVNTAVPPEVDAIVLRALARRPEDRYANARELHDALLPHVSPSARMELVELTRRAQGTSGSATSRPSVSGLSPSGGSLPPALPASDEAPPPPNASRGARVGLGDDLDPPTTTMEEFEALEALDEGPSEAYHGEDPGPVVSLEFASAVPQTDPLVPSARPRGSPSLAPENARRDVSMAPLPVPEAVSLWPEGTQAAPLGTDLQARPGARSDGLDPIAVALVAGLAMAGTALFWWVVLS